MGKIIKTIEDKLISPVPDRNANRVLVYYNPQHELTIHFRNFKIVLHTEEEAREWISGFKQALENFKKGDYFKNDI